MDRSEEADDPQLFFQDWDLERSHFLVFPTVCRLGAVSF